MTEHHDVVVLGLGGVGSAAAAHLAGRGATVLGLEQFGPAHDRGSSHGDSRIIRQAYFEDPAYVPLLQRSFELFEDLDRDDPGLFVQTGGLMLGRRDSAVVAGSLASARAWGLPHELLDAAEVRRRFPAFSPDDDELALYEDRAGFVRPERTVSAHLRRASARGADLRFHTRALSWEADGGGVVVRTTAGTHRADRLLVCPGAWAPQLLAGLPVPLVVERQLLFWFSPSAGVEPFALGRQPVFIWQTASALQLYGFPAIDGPAGGVKVAFFRDGAEADPDALDRVVHPEEVARMRSTLGRTLPGLDGEWLRGLACMYTTTPDEHFVVGPHPDHERVVVAAGFSGHGFKFVPVMGELLADLVLDGATRHELGLFAPTRSASWAGAPERPGGAPAA